MSGLQRPAALEEKGYRAIGQRLCGRLLRSVGPRARARRLAGRARARGRKVKTYTLTYAYPKTMSAIGA